jgi:UDP-N-acetylglucosamine--N-acetylmuramyl-(pentapeptide) pyrophosphoryl-undecaprenol N-acetylglucosamine transferase
MCSDKPLHVIFAGGGTAGHLFPGLAVARCLLEQVPQAEITFVGTGREQERQWVEGEGYPYRAIACRAGPHRLRDVLPFVYDNLRGYLAARRLLRQTHCTVVVGLGGYASVPAARAAIDGGVPLVLLEQNVAPGRATRWLARRAAAVCAAFAETRDALPHPERVIVTGNPLRPGFGRASGLPLPPGEGRGEGVLDAARSYPAQDALTPCPSPDQPSVGARRGEPYAQPFDTPPRQLLILGGSSGARSLNRWVPQALARLGRLLDGWQIVHQSGQNDRESTQLLYARLGISAQVSPFVTDMPQVLRQTSLAVCRAGGTTLAELTASGVPAVLVPYPHAAADHQRKNADWAVAAGGCCVVQAEEDQRLAAALAEVVGPLVADAQRRHRMALAMEKVARHQAAEHVVAVIRRVCRRLLAAR